MDYSDEVELRGRLSVIIAGTEDALDDELGEEARQGLETVRRTSHEVTAMLEGKTADREPGDVLLVAEPRCFPDLVVEELERAGWSVTTCSAADAGKAAEGGHDLVIADLKAVGFGTDRPLDKALTQRDAVVSIYERDGVLHQGFSGVVSNPDELDEEDVCVVNSGAGNEDAEAYVVPEEMFSERGYEVVHELRYEGGAPTPVYLLSDRGSVEVVGGEAFRRRPMNVLSLVSLVYSDR